MYVEENKTQLTLSCIYNMVKYGHVGILKQFIKENNEKALLHSKKAMYSLGWKETYDDLADEGYCPK